MKASSLRLLLPPLRLLTAAVWQVIQQQSVKHYGMLEEFVTLVTEAVPQLLTERQRGVLLLALRAKVTLSHPSDDQTHLERIHSISKASDEELTECCSALLSLSQTPADPQRLLQEVFDQRFDSALQSLLSDLLTRIEQLFPVPDFRQAAYWLHDAPCVLEDSLQETDRKHLTELLTNQNCRLGRATTAVCGETEETLLSAWSHPLLTSPSNPDPAGQSDGGPTQLDVKVEVELMTEDVIAQSVSEEEQEASNQSSEGVTPVVEGGVRWDSDQTLSDPVRMKDSSSQSEGSQLTAISHNSQRVAHRCPACGKCFIYRSQVIRHLRSNRTCGSSGKHGSGAQQGRSEGEPHPVRAHACFQCSSTFTTRTELVAHCRTHLTRPVYRCNQCDSAFQLQSSLTNHKQTHRLPDLSCSVCAQTFSSQARLLRHLQTHSAEGAECIYRCLFCDQSFSGVTQLRIHQRSHSSRSYQCDQCDKSYSSVTGLQSHRATHSGDNRFLCPQCGKCFKTCDGLEGHLRTHSGERPFRCPYCPKDFTAHAGLSVHVRQHTGEKPYVCTVCGKAWPSGGDLQKHMRTHTGERPYVCQECGKAFSISCHLTEHRRIHTGEKPFSCPECGKCFRRRFDLKKHLLSHSNVRPHPCTFCSKSYTRQTHLNRHLLTHRTTDREAEPVEEEAEPVEEA
ncbi:zinc finger protein ZFMSA12A-like isoform X2 [Poecilia formosa]|uniref:zinc finger protein ZFMSA12A-like isoform X2 n=1 Tax=Poecilia formosa TaxID=48698 RepID=UPI0007BA5B97|nr:PREDICTED: zinc finger protein ZFMSA12A-like isoform X2 [Poecilia formosa]